jgi:hypothetical protein
MCMFKVSKNPISDDWHNYIPRMVSISPYFFHGNFSEKSTEEVYKHRKFLMDRLSTTPKEDAEAVKGDIFMLTYILGQRVVDV